ncbi:hypothetical protein B0H12DRAFT_1080438 [Mycena haematopus]|nr:hypothetical protein B0H12DRAFT_1080438 [Mycena haematopus]
MPPISSKIYQEPLWGQFLTHMKTLNFHLGMLDEWQELYPLECWYPYTDSMNPIALLTLLRYLLHTSIRTPQGDSLAQYLINNICRGVHGDYRVYHPPLVHPSIYNFHLWRSFMNFMQDMDPQLNFNVKQKHYWPDNITFWMPVKPRSWALYKKRMSPWGLTVLLKYLFNQNNLRTLKYDLEAKAVIDNMWAGISGDITGLSNP